MLSPKFCIFLALLLCIQQCHSWLGSRLAISSFWKSNHYKNIHLRPLQSTVAPTPEQELAKTELPLDFFDAVTRSVQCTLRANQQGDITRFRIDFDTSIGDMTYTSLKNTLPFVKEYLKQYCQTLELVPAAAAVQIPQIDDNSASAVEANLAFNAMNGMQSNRTVRVFFPDMGAAVLARNDWKLNTVDAEVPRCVSTGNVQNDPLLETDIFAIILCPLYSEADSVKRVLDMCKERSIQCLMINPSLINMDQGFGVKARNLRKTVLDTFTTVYTLKTLRLGAVVRQWPRSYSLWIDDPDVDGGYSWFQNFTDEPAFSEVEEIFDEIENKRAGKKKSALQGAVGEVLGFFQGLSKL